MGFSSPINFGRDICGSLEASEQREWLVTNGIGGFASGTIAGVLTRRYHGLLVAALKPPLGRTLLVTKIDEVVNYNGKAFSLGANRWQGGTIDPRGFELIERFRLHGTTPIWTFACDDSLIEKQVGMEQGANTTYVTYKIVRASLPLRLAFKVLVNYRDFHGGTHAGDWCMDVQPVEHGLRVKAFEGAQPFYLLSSQTAAEPIHTWYRNYDLAVERFRGLYDHEDHLHAATFSAEFKGGESVTLVFSTEAAPNLDVGRSLEKRSKHERSLIDSWNKIQQPIAENTPSWVHQLVLAADAFIVARPLATNPQARTIIAGYHWFGDWGRDTMIALPGLTISTGRAELAKEILLTFAQFADEGMLPNTFPEGGDAPQYNTVDAALWFFEAVRQYFAATRDSATLAELFPILTDIIGKHVRGTRFNIHVDRMDGLLYAGEEGMALTWMDAKVGDRAITPRIGKPVEVNALWFNALLAMARFARSLKKTSSYYENMAARAHEGFARFWNEAGGCCYDVLDGPGGTDASFRPNQIFAVSLPESPLPAKQMRSVVDACEHRLLTPRGLRSLSPDDHQYCGHYAGPPHQRDAAYHQGTVWGWLLGPFALAHLRVNNDPARALSFLEPMAQSITEYGVGTAAEIFDGDAPFAPCGCIAQAWTVAELLRARTEIGNWKPETRN